MASDDERWQRKQAHYRDPAVVAGYDEVRFSTRRQRRSTRRKWRAIAAVLSDEKQAVRTVLDLPCGTGRFTGELLAAGKRVVAADRSLPMLHAARAKHGPALLQAAGALVCCDAEHLPFADRSFDLVLSIRFLFHVPRDRRAGVLKEMRRVSRRWVVVDVRHRYSLTTLGKRLRARLSGRPLPSLRSSLGEIDADLAAAGLALADRAWLQPGFSEKMLLFCRTA